MKETKSQVKVGVGIEALWGAFAKDLRFIIPKVMPNLVRKVDVLEGNGSLGTVYLIEFGSNKSSLGYQKERVTIFDESIHQLGLEVFEGGRLNYELTSYTAIFQFTAIGESDTLVDIKVAYETEAEETHMVEEITETVIGFIKSLEEFLSK